MPKNFLDRPRSKVPKNPNAPERSIDKHSRKLLDNISKTMYENSIEETRDYVANLDLQPQKLRKIIDTAYSEADRSAAILYFAYAEDVMARNLRMNLNGEVKGGWDDVISSNGLLATANDRITLLQLLRWIRPNIYHDLRLLKSIRNRFAHNADVDSFDDEKISQWISALKTTGEIEQIPAPIAEIYSKLTMREKFLARASYVVSNLIIDLAIAPRSRAYRLEPIDVTWSDYDDVAENIKEINDIPIDKFAEVYMDIPRKKD